MKPPAMDIKITEADLDNPLHGDAVVAILDGYAREPAGGGRPLSEDVRRRLIPQLKARNNALILLALADQKPAGVAVCFTGFSTFAARPLLNLHDLAVLPGFRGRGIGHRLLSALNAYALKLECCKITLEVSEDNHGARALYRRFGYGDYNPCDAPVTTLFLEKRL